MDREQSQIIINAAATSTSLTTSAQATFLAGDPGKLLVVVSEGTSGGTTYRKVKLSYIITLLVPIPMNGDVVLTNSRKVALSDLRSNIR